MANTQIKKISLSQGKYALVDKKSFALLNKWKWFYHKNKKDKTGYALRNAPRDRSGKRKHIYMHHAVFGSKFIDHKNGNGLDNREINLRKANAFQQAQNKAKSKSKKSLGCKGVSIVRDKKGVPSYWIARISYGKSRVYLGVFKSHIAASRAYIKKAKELHGEFARWK